MISALILTYNEENIIKQCIEALDFVDEIVVFDSFSTDATEEIVLCMGAKVFKRKFDNYANQRNEALKAISEQTDWILMVDADEIVSPELAAEINTICSSSLITETLFRVRRKDMFEGKWIKHSSGYPTWFGRLFKKNEVWIERDINEEYHTNGKIGYLKEHLIHYPFNKGLKYWFERHNNYSSLEAMSLNKEFQKRLPCKLAFSKDAVQRRKFQKQFIYRLPGRPFIIFLGFFIIRRGFLDGSQGFQFCKLRWIYENMIDLKLKELNQK
jgi:glycosyltransferase involved in cell wall biosynthesis